MTITEKNLARKLSEAFDGRDWKPVVDIIKEVTGHEFAPEPKPLPTEPGAVIIATEVREKTGEWVMVRAVNGDWFSAEPIIGSYWLSPRHITAWTPARVVPEGELEAVRAAQDTLEELAKMGVTEADRGAVLEMAARLAVHGIDSDEVDRMVKQHYSTAQHAAPAEGEPIDVGDVREGDRVRVELHSGDEATITVIRVAPDFLTSERYVFYTNEIRSVRLLHREEA